MPQEDQTAGFKRVRDVVEQDFDFLVELRELAEENSSTRRIGLDSARVDIQTIRRLYVRTLVSLMESVVATLKQDALEVGRNLSTTERVLLSEQTFDLNDKGEAVEKAFMAPLSKSLRFGFRCFAKVHGLSRLPDYSGEGWRDFQELVKVRNRLTHPKEAAGLEVTDADMAIADRAEFWFLRSNRMLMEEYTDFLRAEMSKLKAEASALKGRTQ